MRPERQAITLQRDCEATLIPGGRRVTLLRGDEVIVTQSLGSTSRSRPVMATWPGSAPKMQTRSVSR